MKLKIQALGNVFRWLTGKDEKLEKLEMKVMYLESRIEFAQYRMSIIENQNMNLRNSIVELQKGQQKNGHSYSTTN